jgi:hypothetical protein
MTTHPAFLPVPCKYGAPMGRRNKDGPTERYWVAKWRPSHCGAYDQGGAYWGCGGPIWAAWNHEGLRHYLRAKSKTSALTQFQAIFGP